MNPEVIWDPLKEMFTKITEFVPSLIGAIVILLLGYFIAWIVKKVLTKVLKKIHLDDASERVGLAEVLKKAQLKSTASEIMGKILFWVLFLTFLIPATETLGLEKVSETIDKLIEYLPNVLGAALIVVVGLVVAYFIRNIVWSAAEGIEFQYAEAVGRMTYGVMIIIVAVLAVGQLQIETELLKSVIQIVLFAAGGAIAIAVGLGSQGLARNLMAGLYLQEQYKKGTKVEFDKTDGTVEDVGTVSTVIKTKGGSVHVPNGQMMDTVVKVK
jgi:small-conductance mechanosensitive channel